MDEVQAEMIYYYIILLWHYFDSNSILLPTLAHLLASISTPFSRLPLQAAACPLTGCRSARCYYTIASKTSCGVRFGTCMLGRQTPQC
jgi:hypothetical protein